MAINEYDELLKGEDPSGGNEYAQMLGSETQSQKQSLQAASYVAARQEPDRKAQVLKLAQEVNLPAPFVERNFDELSKKSQTVSTDYDRLIAETPKTAAWLQNPDNHTLAKDDLEGTQKIEKTINDFSAMKSFYYAVNQGLARGYSQISKIPALAYDTFAIPQNLAADALDMPELRATSPDWLVNNPVAKVYDEQARLAETPEMSKSGTEAALKGNYAEAGRIFAIQFAANAPQQAAILAATYFGAGTPALIATGAMTAADKNAENKETDVSPAIGTLNALVAGGTESMMENAGTFGILKTWQKDMTREIGETATREVMKNFAKNMAYSVAAEGNEEAMTSLANDLSDYAMGINPELTLSGTLTRMADSAVLGGASGGGMTAPAGIAMGMQARQRKQDIALARDFYLSLGDSVQGSKLRERLPEAQRQLVEQITKDSPVERIYMPVEDVETYFQSKGVPAAAVMGELGLTQAYEEAKQTGGNIEVPLAHWVDKVVQSEHFKGLQNDIKFDPAEMTVNEYSRESAKLEADMKAQEQQAQEQAKQEPETNKAQEIETNIVEQLVAAGVDRSQAETNARLVSAFFGTMGERSGQDPMALFEKYGLEVSRMESPEADVIPFPTLKRDEAGSIVYEPDVIQGLRGLVASGELIQSGVKRDDSGEVIGNFGGASTFPEFFQNKGYTKKEVLKILDKQSKGQALTEKQQAILEDLYSGYVESLSRQAPQETAFNQSGLNLDPKVLAELEAILPFTGNKDVDDAAQAKLRADPEAYARYLAVLEKLGTREERAKAMGFGDQAVFHGTTFAGEIDKFKSSKSTTGQLYGRGNYTTTDPNEAGVYTEILDFDSGTPLDDQSGAIYPLKSRGSKTFGFEDRVAPAKLKDRFAALIGEKDLPKNWAKIKSEARLQDAIMGKIDPTDYSKALVDSGYDSVMPWSNERVKNVINSKNLRSTFAAFDPRFTDSKNIMYQGAEDGARGRIRIGRNRKIKIDLFAQADLSTFLHETGHFYQEVLADLATKEDAPEQLKKDYETVLKWFGVTSREEVTVEHHEQWARAFERYLMEGKAPTTELQKVFSRFKVWLISVYRQLKALNTPLNDEIRDVFSRMLATEAQLQSAQAELEAHPLFKDAREAGMSEAQALRYKEAREDARRMAEEKVQARLMRDFQRSREEWFKERRAEVTKEVEAEVNSQPVYRALSIILRGKLADGSALPEGLSQFKLDKQSIVDLLGADFLKTLPKGIYAREGGLPVSMAAEALGFETAETMLKEMADSEKKADLVKRLVDQEMQERYPDSLFSNELPAEAVKALHNEKRSEMLRLELEFLAQHNMPVLKETIRRVARRVPTEKEVRAQATKMVGSKKITEIRPHLYRQAEVKAAKEAGERLAKGDIDGAFEAKRRELLNHELYRAAVEAQESVDNALEFFKKLRKKDEDVAKTRDTDLVNAARAIVAQFGLGRPDKPASEYLKNIEKYDPDTYQTVIALVQLGTEKAGPYKEVAFDDFAAMVEVVETLWDLAKTSRQMDVDGKKMDRQEMIDELTAQLESKGTLKELPGFDKSLTDWEKRKLGLYGVRAAMRRVESWATFVDGGDRQGAFTKYFINPIMEATTQYRLAKKARLEQVFKIFEPLKKELGNRDISAPEIGFTFTSKAEILGALLHTGNESNFEKLLLGRGWGTLDANGELDATRWNRMIARFQKDGILTKADYDAIQQVWDLLEQTKPEAQRAHKKMYGHYFNEITSKAFSTPWGNYRGGYAPAIADSDLSADAQTREDKNALGDSQNSFMFPTTGRGFTKSRVEGYHAPLQIDIRRVPQHIDKVLRFIHIEPAVKQVGRLVTDKALSGKLNQFDPGIVKDALIPWLQRTAKQAVSQPSQGRGGKFMDSAARILRKRAGLQAMVLNVTNALQNFTGLTLAAIRVSPRKLGSSLYRYMKAPRQSAAFVTERSDFMKTRIGQQAHDIQKAIDEVILNPSKYDRVADAAIHHGYIFQRVTQDIMEVTTWMAKYDEAIGDGMSEKEAVRAADNAVRETQGAMNPEDVSRAETGAAFTRLFTQFYTYFNMQANLLQTEFSLAKEMGLKAGMSRGLYVYTFGFMAPAVIAELIVRAMSGRGADEDDDGEYIDDVLALFFGSQFRTATAMVPGVGPAIMAGINMWNDKAYDDRISTSPALAMIERSLKAPLSVKKTIFDDGSGKPAIQDSLTAIGMITGLPAAPLGRPLGYLADVSGRKTEATGPIDFTRGLITGKSDPNP